MVTIDGAKMSKSAGNFVTLEELFEGNHDLLEKGFDPMVVRFLMLQSHYRSKIDFSNEALTAAEKGYQRLMNAAETLHSLDTAGFKELGEGSEDDEIQNLCSACFDTMNDDFNTAQTLASLFELASKINALQHGQMNPGDVSLQAFTALSKTFDDVVFDIFGLKESDSGKNSKTEELVELLIEIRAEARQKKDFATSDKIRDDLQEIGIQLKDDKSGQTTFTIN
jgi:cysteinyl-tRNA synthetase